MLAFMPCCSSWPADGSFYLRLGWCHRPPSCGWSTMDFKDWCCTLLSGYPGSPSLFRPKPSGFAGLAADSLTYDIGCTGLHCKLVGGKAHLTWPLQTFDSCHHSKHLNTECHHSQHLNSECHRSKHWNSECHHFKRLNSVCHHSQHLNSECLHLQHLNSECHHSKHLNTECRHSKHLNTYRMSSLQTLEFRMSSLVTFELQMSSLQTFDPDPVITGNISFPNVFFRNIYIWIPNIITSSIWILNVITPNIWIPNIVTPNS